jgi:penicillin-binding protein 2
MPIKQAFLTNPDFASELRYKIIRYLIIFLAILFIGRLAYLQIIKGSIYRSESAAQAIKEETIEPFRGIIFDRNGSLLVHNEPSYTLSIIPRDFSRAPGAISLLSSILEIDTTEISKRLEAFVKIDRYHPQKILHDIPFDAVAKIEEYHEALPGVSIVIESKRLYNFNVSMAHLLGYTREISQDEINKMKENLQKINKIINNTKDSNTEKHESKIYYRPGDAIGKSGIEKSYEELIRGSKGIKFVTVNRSGEKVANYNEGKNDSLVRNGFDLYLTIDKRLQELAEKELQDKHGAVVVMEPSTGDILAIASKPDYDLRKFSGKVPTEVYNELRDDPGTPLYNRAIQSGYPPGSTWKMLVALAGLQEKLIDTKSTIVCPGSFQFGNRSYECHGSHGSVNVEHAIQASCNVFFYRLGLKVGLQKMTEYAKMFGFGEKTNIDIPDEKRGFFPRYDWVVKKFGISAVQGRTVNYGIGQGEILVTPLQMATYASTIANRGFRPQPHTVKVVYNNILNFFDTLSFPKKELPIEKKYFDIVVQGMYDVVNVPGGTAAIAKVPGIDVCGKTGTAQNPHGRPHSWFVCFAPKDNPKIAIAVIVENAGFGAVVAAPIARSILAAYFYPDPKKAPSGVYTSPAESGYGD